jgi:hypothetical protein
VVIVVVATSSALESAGLVEGGGEEMARLEGRNTRVTFCASGADGEVVGRGADRELAVLDPADVIVLDPVVEVGVSRSTNIACEEVLPSLFVHTGLITPVEGLYSKIWLLCGSAANMV